MACAAALLAAAAGCFCAAAMIRGNLPPVRSVEIGSRALPSQPIRGTTPAPEPARFSTTLAPLRRAPLPGPFTIQPVRAIDGDTFEGRLRIWFGQEITTLVRLRNVNAPELKARCPAEAQLAEQARQTLEEILSTGSVMLTAVSLDKYAGRIVADVSVAARSDAIDDVGELLLAGGYARRYGGGRRQGWCAAEAASTGR